MKDNTSLTPKAEQTLPENGLQIAELKAQIDERDEIIRALNEALSRALDELDLKQAA